jgi:hypothetical protein
VPLGLGDHPWVTLDRGRFLVTGPSTRWWVTVPLKDTHPAYPWSVPATRHEYVGVLSDQQALTQEHSTPAGP